MLLDLVAPVAVTRRRAAWLAFVALCFCVAPLCLGGERVVPLAVRDQNPFIHVFGLPPADSALVTPAGRTRTKVTLDITNNSIVGSAGSETIVLDGETYRLTLGLRHGLSETVELGIDLPVVAHSPGVFDGFVENWHELFGLSNGRRTIRPRNELSYVYTDGAATVYNIQRATSGIGDILFSAGLQLGQDRNPDLRAIILRTGVKLPTGDPDVLHGSGGTDWFVSISGGDDGRGARTRFVPYGTLGILALGDGDVLPSRARDLVGFGTLGCEWRKWERLRFKAQFDFHTSFYESALDQLDPAAGQFTLGGSLRLGTQSYFDLGVVENLFTDTTPDVTFHLALRAGY